MTIIGKVNGIISQCIGRGEHPRELEPVALALLAIDKHNKEERA